MHEYSIVQALMEQCESLAAEHQATTIRRVEVKIGVLSGVEPYLLQTAFDTFKESSVLCQQAQLVLQHQSLVGQCQQCGERYEMSGFGESCATCKDSLLTIVDGDALMLMKLEMDS
ncbi:hydrogenase maturation nickel metallochaperone HypA [Hydrogenovibrio sp. SC-1]|uniref:hydrogenase maturation nickel metallochaperone HypA/HybF n=1 Tax=Hydrogenovibrio sp. SC-1 TaxID=2065820 RepID=UPI000C7CD8CA|nr:hydrogenase maturation nickel metallochaperone HypA [Hydrogenovibrio sp. SC-1]PLA74531.1 hydrogenase maturation nickel metallochaperone HypA [Hydrogenovibrio sp. SC-1]